MAFVANGGKNATLFTVVKGWTRALITIFGWSFGHST